MDISTNGEIVDEHTSNLVGSASTIFSKSKMDNIDEKTTLSANKNLQDAYSYMEEMMEKLGDAIECDCNNMKKIHSSFEEVDKMSEILFF